MAKYRCDSCGGTYTTPQAGGFDYYHGCPPHANPDFQPDPAKPNHNTLEILEHADKRDENIKEVDSKGHITIVSEGKGRTKIAD